MHKNRCFFIGFIARTHGLKGGLAAQIEEEFIPSLENTESVFVEINNSLVPFFIEELSGTSQSVFIKFEDVNDLGEAKALLRTHLYLPNDLKPKAKKDPLKELNGFLVIDSIHGELGRIEELLEYPHQLLARMNWQNKEVLFPVNEHIITRTDKSKKTLFVTLPEGLLDIYLH